MITRAILIVSLMLLTQSTFAQSIQAPRLHVLDNGMRVITVEDHSNELVTTTWSAHVGESAEPLDFAGNSHYLEHLLLFRGTEKFPKNEIGEWVAGRGGWFNGHTWYDYTTFEITAAPFDLDAALERHEQMMFFAAFSGEDFETEKKAVFEELRSGLDTPYGYLFQSSAYDMYPQETFYSRSTIGSINTVQAATIERVREYYKDYYVPNNMTLAVVGDMDTDATLAAIESRFGSYPSAPVPETIYRPLSMKTGITLVTEEREVGKAYFLMAFEGPQATSPEYFPYRILAEYLAGGQTSLLKARLVTQQKIVDDIYMSDWPRRYPKGWQAIAAETKPENAAGAVNAIWLLLKEVSQAGIAPQGFKLAQKRLVKNHRVVLDDQYQYASRLVETDAHGDFRLIADFETRLQEVTLADVQMVARKYFDPGNFFLKSIFPPGTIPEQFADQVGSTANLMTGGASSIKSETLESGLTLVYEKRPAAAMDSYTIGIRAGDRDGAQAGLADAVSQLMARETENRNRTELKNFLDQAGFTLNSWTDPDGTFFSLQTPPGSSEIAMQFLMELLTAPGFSQDEWDNTRDEMLAELKSAQDQPNAIARDLLYQTVFEGSPYARSMAETTESLNTLTTRQLKKFWSEYYKASSMVVSYVGSASSDELEAGFNGLKNHSGKAPLRDPIKLETKHGQTHQTRPMEGKTQTVLYMAWPAPDLLSEQWVLWELAQKAIGGDLAGRLWKLRQDEGLAYSVNLSGSENADQPLTHVYMATAGEKREKALAAINREVLLAHDGLTQAELERVKVSYLAALNRYDRTVRRRSDRHANWWVKGFTANRRDELQRIIATATLESVNQVIGTVLDPENYVLVEAGLVPE